MAVKVWHHTSLAVSDLERAVDFYRRAFGYEVLYQERGMAEQIARMTGMPGLTCDLAQLRSPVSGHVLELIAFKGAGSGDPQPLRPGAAHVAFYVDDLEAALAKVERLGAVRLGEITQFDEGRSVYCREPAGSFFELEQLKGG
jgi:catechol 2,3-dioxygenase-like lactoylglutathione lyase family enzyme